MAPQNTTPVERILASLAAESSNTEDYSACETEVPPIAEIERLPLERVTVELNNAGLNYVAGLERLRELVGAAAEHKKEYHTRLTSHDEKREVFERHFLFGKLSAGEIDTLISYSRVERYPAGRE